MIKQRGRSIGRKVIMSSRMMNILPWIGVVIATIGFIGIILGILTAVVSSLPLTGAAVTLVGLGVFASGIVLFFAMCIVQDITGMF